MEIIGKIVVGIAVVFGLYCASALRAGPHGDSGIGMHAAQPTVQIGTTDITDAEHFDSTKIRDACDHVGFFKRPIMGGPLTVRAVFNVVPPGGQVTPIGESIYSCSTGQPVSSKEYR